MKKIFIAIFMTMCSLAAFAQVPAIAVAAFDVQPNSGISRDESGMIYELFITELVSVSAKAFTVVDRVNLDRILAEMKFQTSDWSNPVKTTALGRVLNAKIIVQGRFLKMDNKTYWVVSMLDLNTAAIYSASRTRLGSMSEAWDVLPNFCKTLVEKIKTPPPNAPGIPTVAVATFDVQGGIAKTDAETVTDLFLTELVARNDLRVVDRVNFDKIIGEMRFQSTDWSDSKKTAALGGVLNAGIIIRGQLMKVDNSIWWTATILDVNTAQILSSARLQLKSLDDVWTADNLSKFAQQIVSQLPPPNFFVGRWQATASYRKDNYTYSLYCIFNFQADGTVLLENYDTVEIIIHQKKDIFGYWKWNATNYETGSYAKRKVGTYTVTRSSGNTFRLTLNSTDKTFFDNATGSLVIDNPNAFNGWNFNCVRTWVKRHESSSRIFTHSIEFDSLNSYRFFTRLQPTTDVSVTTPSANNSTTSQTQSANNPTSTQTRPTNIPTVYQTQLPANFVRVEGGTFQMGNPSGGENDERPVHTVTVKSFNMSKYEITQKEWYEVMGTTIAQQRDMRDKSLSLYGEGDNYPMYYVSWYEAVEYCNKRSLKEGLTPTYSGSGDNIICDWNANGYRLPTEAEWEYAARGGNGSLGNYTYAGSNSVDAVAWYDYNSGSRTQPVGTKAANSLGIHDMSGNVSEWCWDWYGDYSGSSQTDPRGPVSGARRVRRGGSWYFSAAFARSVIRSYWTPSAWHFYVGFRLVRN